MEFSRRSFLQFTAGGILVPVLANDVFAQQMPGAPAGAAVAVPAPSQTASQSSPSIEDLLSGKAFTDKQTHVLGDGENWAKGKGWRTDNKLETSIRTYQFNTEGNLILALNKRATDYVAANSDTPFYGVAILRDAKDGQNASVYSSRIDSKSNIVTIPTSQLGLKPEQLVERLIQAGYAAVRSAAKKEDAVEINRVWMASVRGFRAVYEPTVITKEDAAKDDERYQKAGIPFKPYQIGPATAAPKAPVVAVELARAPVAERVFGTLRTGYEIPQARISGTVGGVLYK